MNKNVNNWSNETTTYPSAFLGTPEKPRGVEKDEDVDDLLNYVKEKTDNKEKECLKNLLDNEASDFYKSFVNFMGSTTIF